MAYNDSRSFEELVNSNIFKKFFLLNKNKRIPLIIGDKNMQGKGYGTEAAKAWLDFGLKKFPTYPISAYVDARHEASKRVLEKIGMKKTSMSATL